METSQSNQKVMKGEVKASVHSTNGLLKGLIYKNLQNPAEGGTAPRPMIPTAVICCQVCQHGMHRHPSCYTPLGRIYRVFVGFY